MNKKLTVVALLMTLALLPFTAGAQRLDRGYDLSHASTFVRKGTWMVGGSAKYSFNDLDNYSFASADRTSLIGYKLAVSPAFCYMRRDNLGIGMRLEYGRKMANVDTAGVNIAGIGLAVNEYHTISQDIKAKAILRNYIPIGDSKVFALVNETQISFGYGQSKIARRQDQGVIGTYQTNYNIALNICPGMMAFASEHLAVEFSINMLGLTYNDTRQVHNRVSKGSVGATSINFQINILSIGFGLYYYL